MPYGTATPTIGNNPVPFTYAGTGATVALGIGFIPTVIQMRAATLGWTWIRGLGFGVAYNTTSPSESLISTGGVLDILDGSGAASTNVATTSQVIGLLIGTNTIINNGGAPVYYGLAFR